CHCHNLVYNPAMVNEAEFRRLLLHLHQSRAQFLVEVAACNQSKDVPVAVLADAGPAKGPASPKRAGTRSRGTVQQRLLQLIQEDPLWVSGRSARLIAERLQCSKSQVIESTAWKQIIEAQILARAERREAFKARSADRSARRTDR